MGVSREDHGLGLKTTEVSQAPYMLEIEQWFSSLANEQLPHLVQKSLQTLGNTPQHREDAEEMANSALWDLYHYIQQYNNLNAILEKQEYLLSKLSKFCYKRSAERKRSINRKRKVNRFTEEERYLLRKKLLGNLARNMAIETIDMDDCIETYLEEEYGEIARLLRIGSTREEIANQLNCGERSIRRRIEEMKKKLENKRIVEQLWPKFINIQ